MINKKNIMKIKSKSSTKEFRKMKIKKNKNFIAQLTIHRIA
jgi:hypothetical protein